MTKYLVRAACLAFGLATMPAAAYTQTTAHGMDACHKELSELMQATCVGATAASFASDEVDESVAQPRQFFLNQWGGINRCTRATTDTEVEWCAGELPTTSPANPARFDCRKAEVDAEYEYCGKPFPKRHR